MMRRKTGRLPFTRSLLVPAVCLLLSLCCLFCSGGAQADRVVLSPLGDTLPIDSFRAEYVTGTNSLLGDLSWFAVSSSSGIELEVQRLTAATEDKKRYSFNIEYPQLSFERYLSVSYGVRDVTGTGTEHGAFYVAAMTPIRFYGRRPLLREIRVNVGVGTGRMDGLFLGVEARLFGDIRLSGELYRHRPNVGIALPLVRNLQARAYSLDGNIYYGMAFSWTH